MQRREPREREGEVGAVDIARIVAQAAVRTAQDLVAGGFDAACAHGIHVCARKGRYRFLLCNDVRQGPPDSRERMRELFAALVARNLVSRFAGPPRSGEGGRQDD